MALLLAVDGFEGDGLRRWVDDDRASRVRQCELFSGCSRCLAVEQGGCKQAKGDRTQRQAEANRMGKQSVRHGPHLAERLTRRMELLE